MNLEIANFFYQLSINHLWLLKVWQFSAAFGIFVVPLGLLLLFFWPAVGSKNKNTGLLALVAALFGWLILANLISNFFPQSRPPLPSLAWPDPLFHRPQTSFPSEHATALFAITFVFAFAKYKRLALTFLILAFWISIARVSVAIHSPLDILSGIGVGLISAILIWLAKGPLEKFFNPFVQIFVKLKL